MSETSFRRSRWWLAFSFVVSLSCLTTAVVDSNPGLGLVGVVGLGAWIWQLWNRNQPTTEPLTRQEAIARIAAHKARYLGTYAVGALATVAFGALATVAGSRGDDQVQATLGVLLTLIGLIFCVLVVRLGLIVRQASRE